MEDDWRGGDSRTTAWKEDKDGDISIPEGKLALSQENPILRHPCYPHISEPIKLC